MNCYDEFKKKREKFTVFENNSNLKESQNLTIIQRNFSRTVTIVEKKVGKVIATMNALI